MLGTAQPRPAKGSQARLKARRRRQFARDRKACRAARYALDGGCCVRCGTPLKLTLQEGDWWNVANIHERHPRSLGGSAIDVANTETVCSACHVGKGFHAK